MLLALVRVRPSLVQLHVRAHPVPRPRLAARRIGKVPCYDSSTRGGATQWSSGRVHGHLLSQSTFFKIRPFGTVPNTHVLFTSSNHDNIVVFIFTHTFLFNTCAGSLG